MLKIVTYFLKYTFKRKYAAKNDILGHKTKFLYQKLLRLQIRKSNWDMPVLSWNLGCRIQLKFFS